MVLTSNGEEEDEEDVGIVRGGIGLVRIRQLQSAIDLFK
jgi:hypothetical protein